MSSYPYVGITIKGVGFMGGIVRTGARLVLAALAMSMVLVPASANASGGYTLSCQGASPVPVVPNSNVTCVRPEKASDDDGAYVFTYSPPMTCGAAGTFSVTVTGGEMQIGPANGSYVTTAGHIHANFTYTVLEKSVPPAIEMHSVALDIDCATGVTVGTLSE
jgi:hypothetical protein